YAEPIDLREVVKGTIGMLRTAGRIKHLDVTVQLPEAPVTATVNRTRIEQVLVNLLINAADAMETGSGAKRLVVRVEQDTVLNRIRCEVEDTGEGIPSEKLDRIFEPYYTTKQPGRGTGLGLSVVKQIVESYGGQVRVTSRVGEGTTFSFE